jgi:hypothetical protein
MNERVSGRAASTCLARISKCSSRRDIVRISGSLLSIADQPPGGARSLNGPVPLPSGSGEHAVWAHQSSTVERGLTIVYVFTDASCPNADAL